METIAKALGWANYVMSLTWVVWFSASIVVGGILIARDEWRLRRTRLKPEAIRAYADQLEVAHGREAFRLNGDAMYEARRTKGFDRHWFLKEVSGELVARLCDKSRVR